MDTEEKKLTSSEIEKMLKEVEEVHQSRRTLDNRKNSRKKRPKIRLDIILAVIIAVAVIAGAITLIVHFSKGSNSGGDKEAIDNPLMDEKYPEISDVVKNYLNAYLIEDSQKRLDTLAQYVDNMGDANEADISQKKYIKSYSNIECYTKEGPYENTYVVYAYYEMEFKNISTLAPTITRLYVIRDAKTGSVYIHNGVSGDVQKYINDVTKDADVQDLFNEVNKDFEEALESDSRLKDFYTKLEEAKETTATAAKETNQAGITAKEAETMQPATTKKAAETTKATGKK